MLQQLLQIKKIKKSFSCSLLILGVFIAQVSAHIVADEVVDSLYQVQVSIPADKQNDKEIYFQNGLRTVLQRITGTQLVLENQNIWDALEAPMSYIQQFSHQDDQLVMHFSENLVNNLVLQNGFTVWGQNRPTLILWLGIAEEQQRQIVGSESHPALYKTLEQFAASRGLQLVLPLMDLVDMDQVMVSDLWGQFPSVMTTASERYGANAILIGRMTKKESDWEGHWELLINNQPFYHKVSVTSFENALMKGVSFAISQLQTQFAVNESKTQSQSFFVDIRGIYSALELNAAEAYLNGLDQLKDVSIKEIAANKVVFEITPQGHVDKNILSQVINMDKHFSKVPPFEENKNELTLTYRWIPE